MVDSVDPRTGRVLRSFPAATVGDATEAVEAATEVAASGALVDTGLRAASLRAISAAIQSEASPIVAGCEAETGLPTARLEGELERTWRQLDSFAAIVEAGSLFDAIIDTADPEARPIPRPDLRRMTVPIGSVAVFGAGNFPLAFGVVGGDTASALAAGCPVVVKGHPSHPATNEMIGRAALSALDGVGAPAGSLALLQSAEFPVGEALVTAPGTAAVAFTGSLRGGRALFDLACRRPNPIPAFAEMGSVNPMVVTEAALAEGAADVAAGLTAAVTGSAGQLCTKPGLVFVPATPAGESFEAEVAAGLGETSPQPMLDRRIWEGLRSKLVDLQDAGAVSILSEPSALGEDDGFRISPRAYRSTASALTADSRLREEYFGPVVVFVAYESTDELIAALDSLSGQLTATIHAGDGEDDEVRRLIAVTERRVGRLVFGQFPTGVAVSWAQQHGGPYPATTAPATTSVGMTAAQRFQRAVAFQNAPGSVLPPALRDANPLGIWRRVDGEITRDPIG